MRRIQSTNGVIMMKLNVSTLHLRAEAGTETGTGIETKTETGTETETETEVMIIIRKITMAETLLDRLMRNVTL